MLRRLTDYMTRLMLGTDAAPEWCEDESTEDVIPSFAVAALRPELPRIEDMRDECRSVTYTRGRMKGKRKAALYPRVDMAPRDVLVCLHQTGVNRADSNSRHKLITAHYVVTPSGRILWLYDHDVRLIAANRADRYPYHAISIEFVGNFEGVDGKRDWYRPDLFGAGRATDAQIQSGRFLVRSIARYVAGMGASVAAIIPHRISGRGSSGKPNRPLCPGSRVWSMVAEAVSAADGIPLPAPDVTLGGLTVPESWHGLHWPDVQRLGLASWRPE